jgi:hypothetical protein
MHPITTNELLFSSGLPLPYLSPWLMPVSHVMSYLPSYRFRTAVQCCTREASGVQELIGQKYADFTNSRTVEQERRSR